jgi:hypothetical protein
MAEFFHAALVALLTGFSYAEMTTSFPHAGAECLQRATKRIKRDQSPPLRGATPISDAGSRS